MTTTKTKHTPGPWSYDPDNYFHSAGDCWITDREANTVTFVESGNKADAYLIAAAPDLLAACKAIAWVLEAFASDPRLLLNLQVEQLPKLRAVIAKAEGTDA